MKIGILTFHSANNYGAKLQAYALTKYLQNIGYNAELINYRPEYFDKIYQWIDKNKLHTFNPFKLISYILKWSITGYYRYKRFKAFERFEKKLMTLSPVVSETPDSYDIYIIGSDQVWSKEITKGGDKNYLCDFNFIKGNRIYISYAPSFERVEMTSQSKPFFRELLSRFDHLSVRENTLIDYLSPLTSKTITQVLDPTFLLRRKEWDLIAGERIIKEPYIAFYQVRSSKKALDKAKEIAKKKGCKLINLVAYIRIGKDNRYSAYSPDQFVNIIKYADAIITTSFHGTAFSVIYEKEFFALSLGDGKDARVRSLLASLKLENRILNVDDPVIFNKIDYKEANQLLEIEREKSYAFINNSLTCP